VAAVIYSVQQIKFEFLSYIKEFGGEGNQWSIGLSANGVPPEIEEEAGSLIWICKPAVSPRAAAIVLEHMVSRFNVKTAEQGDDGKLCSWVYLFQRSQEPRMA
jgi:hypothetical protein